MGVGAKPEVTLVPLKFPALENIKTQNLVSGCVFFPCLLSLGCNKIPKEPFLLTFVCLWGARFVCWLPLEVNAEANTGDGFLLPAGFRDTPS